MTKKHPTKEEPSAKRSASLKEHYRTPAGTLRKIAHSRLLKELWKDKDYIASQRERSEKYFFGSTVMKKRWHDPAFREMMCQVRKEQAANQTKKYRKANSDRLKLLWQDPDYRAKQMATRRKRCYDNPAWLSKLRKGCKNKPYYRPWNKGETKETHRSLAKVSQKLLGRLPDYNKYGRWYVGINGKIAMRSRYEVAYALYLDSQKIKWMYEQRTFYIGEGKWLGQTYTPDFYLIKDKMYVEVKGRYTKENKRKMKAFAKKFPKITLQLLLGKQLHRLVSKEFWKCADKAKRVGTIPTLNAARKQVKIIY